MPGRTLAGPRPRRSNDTIIAAAFSRLERHLHAAQKVASWLVVDLPIRVAAEHAIKLASKPHADPLDLRLRCVGKVDSHVGDLSAAGTGGILQLGLIDELGAVELQGDQSHPAHVRFATPCSPSTRSRYPALAPHTAQVPRLRTSRTAYPPASKLLEALRNVGGVGARPPRA